MIRRHAEDRYTGSWVGLVPGLTDDMLRDVGVGGDDIAALRLGRLVASIPAQDAPLTFGEAAENVRNVWNPRTHRQIRLPERWLKCHTRPKDYIPARVHPNR